MYFKVFKINALGTQYNQELIKLQANYFSRMFIRLAKKDFLNLLADLQVLIVRIYT